MFSFTCKVLGVDKCVGAKLHFKVHLSSASLFQKKRVKLHDDGFDLIHSTISCDLSGEVGDNCHEATINSDMDDSVVFVH